MDEVLEQFIASDRSKSTSNIFYYLGIFLAAVGVLSFVKLGIIAIALLIASAALIVASYLLYIDYEYEMYEGNITITRIYKASRRKIAQKIERDCVRKVYVVDRKDALKNGVTPFFNTRLEGLKIYTFELNNNKKIQLALNNKLSSMVDIYYKQQMMSY